MGDLFGHKAVSRGMVIYADAERGIYSSSLELWCRKLNDLSPEHFKTGIAGLEQKAEDDYRNGEEMWPPSYAEFRALCFPHASRDTQAHKILPSVIPHLQLEDQTEKERLRELGKSQAAALVEMFKDPEPAPDEKLYAPFCGSQIRALMLRQADSTKQPYTCGYCDSQLPLVPTESGLACKSCEHKQNWAFYADTQRKQK